MSQSDVLRVLEKNKDVWMSTNEISDCTKANRSTTGRCCSRLRKTDFVKVREVPSVPGKGGRTHFEYKFNGTVW